MKENKKNIKVVLLIITYTILLIYCINHIGMIMKMAGVGLSIIFPFLVGCAIAFVINIFMKGIENAFFKNPKSRIYKSRRAISMIISYIIAIFVIFLVVFVVAPEVAESIKTIGNKFPAFFESLKSTVIKYTDKYPDITKYIMELEIEWKEVMPFFTDKSSDVLSIAFSFFSSLIGFLINAFIGIIFSVYILLHKENLARQTKQVSYAIFKESTADEIMVFGKIAKTTFARFLVCQFREGLILGTLVTIGMYIFGMPYPLTIGVLVAFTALIPIFGATIGVIVGSFLILVESPSMVIWFVIMFLLLQALENYVIYPRLVGEGIGLSAIWVLLAVIVGGKLMGVIGMFIFIPLVSVVYTYARSLIKRKLVKLDIDIESKVVPDDAMPFMEDKRRKFQPKNKEDNNKKTSNKKTENQVKGQEQKK